MRESNNVESMAGAERNLIEIDGSYGEGGGQILRTALALSAIHGKPLRVFRIRAGRKNPGLQPQHLMVVKALAHITSAHTEGAQIGSESITFVPQKVLPGRYRFDVGTAGSVTLLLQGLLPPLSVSEKPSQLTLVGGTHVSWSPPFHFFSEVLVPILNKFGISISVKIERWGWYPKGGGVIHVEIHSSPALKATSLVDRGALKGIRGLSATSHLPNHVGERQRDYAVERIKTEVGIEPLVSLIPEAPASGPGSFIFLLAEFETGLAGFSSLGKRGKRAEDVSKEAVDSLLEYLKSNACIDPHLADQLVPFMALARGHSAFTTSEITGHLLSNLWVTENVIGSRIQRSGEKGAAGRVEFFNE